MFLFYYYFLYFCPSFQKYFEIGRCPQFLSFYKFRINYDNAFNVLSQKYCTILEGKILKILLYIIIFSHLHLLLTQNTIQVSNCENAGLACSWVCLFLF